MAFPVQGIASLFGQTIGEGDVELFLSFLSVSASNPTRCGAPGTRFR